MLLPSMSWLDVFISKHNEVAAPTAALSPYILVRRPDLNNFVYLDVFVASCIRNTFVINVDAFGRYMIYNEIDVGVCKITF